MATTYANNYMKNAFKSFGSNLGVLDVTHEITTAELGTADKIVFGRVPSGSSITGGYIACDDLDAVTSITIAVGIFGGDADALLTANTIARTGGIATFDGALILNKTTTSSEVEIALTIGVGSGTPQAGTVRIVTFYSTL
jgi:hypothetical protein